MQLVHFDFNSSPFELHDDAYVLKSMKSSQQLHTYEPEMGYHEAAEEDCCASPSNYVTPYTSSHSPTTSLSAQYKSSGIPEKVPISPPVPGILKARAKQDHMTQFL
ncbi:hypothetical protein O6H91_Y387200 [Diphasiastrum complanatum]|nr:hypothetical protein O6H91_Y387200 [Diphasiastrum complanatum]